MHKKKITYLTLLVSVIGFVYFIFANSGKPVASFYLISEGLWCVKVLVNEQPVMIGSGNLRRNVSGFFKQGLNDIEIIKVHGSNFPGKSSTRIVQVLNDSKRNTIAQITGTNKEKINQKKFQVTLKSVSKKSWEVSEKISKLTDKDKSEIIAIENEYFQSFKEKDLKSIQDLAQKKCLHWELGKQVKLGRLWRQFCFDF